jgi:hypothetical protein
MDSPQGWGVAQGYSACQAFMRPWIWSPANTEKQQQKQKTHPDLGSYHIESTGGGHTFVENTTSHINV